MNMLNLRCPKCRERIVRPAREGGHMIKSKTIRVTPEGVTVLDCPGCRTPLTVVRQRLVFFAAKSAS